MPFAQLVIGPPGCGKSTYCDGMHQFLSAMGRQCSVVNLDPANDSTSYPAALDVRELVSLEEVMDDEELGPNGGVLYALEAVEANPEWLEEGLRKLGDDYILFDCPGQVELFTHHDSLRNILSRLQNLGYRVRLASGPPQLPRPANLTQQLITIHLLDAHAITLPSLYISSLLLALRSMLQLDIPHLNVLSKIDTLASYSPPPPLPLSFYTSARGLEEHLLPHLDAELRATGGAASNGKFSRLNAAIVELVDDFGLVAFETLAVEDRDSMARLLRAADRASGYVFGPAEGMEQRHVFEMAVRDAPGVDVGDVEERWVGRRAEMDEQERREWEREGKRERGETDGTAGGKASTKRGGSGVKVVRKAATSAHREAGGSDDSGGVR